MEKNNKFKIIIPFYNPGDYLDLAINSVLTQDYDNFDVLFIDDCSTDQSYSKIPACSYKNDENGNPVLDENGELIIIEKHPILEVTKCNKINAWRSNSRMTALPNIHNAIINYSDDPDDIIFILYGDDWLSNKNVLKKINQAYNESECLITYGSAKLSDGKKSYSSQYRENEFNYIRKITQKFTYPITFRRSLYDKFIELDPKCQQFLDKENKWFNCCSFQAITFPLLEIAGFYRTYYINEILYIYNVDNPLNSERNNPNSYFETQEIIFNKPTLIKK